MIRSVEQDTSLGSFWNVCALEEGDSLEATMKDYNSELADRLQKVYSAIGTCNEEIAGLKSQNEELVRNNRKKEKKIALAERELR